MCSPNTRYQRCNTLSVPACLPISSNYRVIWEQIWEYINKISLDSQGSLLIPSMLPSGDSESFKETVFFQRQYPLTNPRWCSLARDTGRRWRPPIPVVFSALNLLVKFDRHITIVEDQRLWAIRHLLPSVLVPEVYGWCGIRRRRSLICNW